jgi:hypothetical protein
MVKQILILTLLIISASNAVSSYSQNVDVGPFAVKFMANLSTQPIINITEPVEGDGFESYGFQIKTGNFRSRVIDVVIHDYENVTDVSETRLMDSITNMIESKSYKLDWDNKVAIGGIAGVKGKVRESDSSKSYQIAAFSPDGNDGKGNITVFIRSSFPDDVTNSFLRDFLITRINSTSN